MADVPTTLSLLTLSQTHRGDVVRQINRSVQLLKTIPIRMGEGKNCAWAVEKDGALVENYSDGADATNFGGDVQAQAILNWALYRSNFHVTQLTMDAAATSYDPLGNRQVWARQLVNASSVLAAHINGKLFNGPGTGTEIAGLDVAIGLDNNTYAGINRATGGNEYWKPYVVDSASAPLTFAQMRDDQRAIYEACGENPDIAYCDPTVFMWIGNLFDDTRRNVTVNTITTARGSISLDFGFGALEVDGMFFVKDRQATDATIYYVNTNHVALEVLPSAEQRQLLKLMEMDVQANDGYGQVPLSFHYEMLAKNGASDRAQVLCTPQLVVRRPNTCGVRKNVAAGA